MSRDKKNLKTFWFCLSVAEFVRYVIVRELDRCSLLTSKIQRLKEEFGEANTGGKEKNE
jgi:hypothetical protein